MAKIDKEVWDTNILLKLCASTNNRKLTSRLDRDAYATDNFDAIKEKAELFILLQEKNLVVPEVVITELKKQSQKENDEVSPQNKRNVKDLIEILNGCIVKSNFCKEDYEIQKEVFSSIEAKVEEIVANLEKQYGTNLYGWERKNIHGTRDEAYKKLSKIPTCVTWQKINRFKKAVNGSVNGTYNPKFLLHDLQIVIIAKHYNATIKSEDKDMPILKFYHDQIIKNRQKQENMSIT